LSRVGRRLCAAGSGDALIRGGLGVGCGSLVGFDLLLLGNFDGKGVGIEGHLVGVQLTLAVADSFGSDGQTRNHGRDVHICAAKPEGFFAFDLGVVSEVDDGRRALLHIDDDQVAMAGGDGAGDFAFFAGFEFLGWGGRVSEASYQKDEGGKIDESYPQCFVSDESHWIVSE
jgi:hypothetical protein